MASFSGVVSCLVLSCLSLAEIVPLICTLLTIEAENGTDARALLLTIEAENGTDARALRATTTVSHQPPLYNRLAPATTKSMIGCKHKYIACMIG